MKPLMMAGAMVLAGLAGSAAAAKSDGSGGLTPQQCFRASDIQNSIQVNESRLNIVTYDHRYFRVDWKGRCFEAPFIDAYVLTVRGAPRAQSGHRRR